MTPSDYQQKKDEILGNLLALGEMYSLDDLAEASKALDELFLEVVGEDELPVNAFKMVGVPAFQRDKLRASIRNIIEGEK